MITKFWPKSDFSHSHFLLLLLGDFLKSIQLISRLRLSGKVDVGEGAFWELLDGFDLEVDTFKRHIEILASCPGKVAERVLKRLHFLNGIINCNFLEIS